MINSLTIMSVVKRLSELSKQNENNICADCDYEGKIFKFIKFND